MTTRVIIAGGRDYIAQPGHLAEVLDILVELNPEEIVSGGAKGGDQVGEAIARYYNIPLSVFHAAWNIFGKAAGPKRNAQMADYADVLIALPGGKGTRNMINEMRKRNKPVYEIKDIYENKTD